MGISGVGGINDFDLDYLKPVKLFWLVHCRPVIKKPVS